MLILLRHGQTAANASALLQGRMNLPLDDVGRIQAVRCGAFIRENFAGARVISSPLLRAVQTASSISDNVEIDDRFIELDYGDWDGVPMSEVDSNAWNHWRTDPSFRPPGGESLIELDARVRPALEDVREEATTRHVVVVSHVSPIKSAITWALGVGPDVTWRCHLDRASMCRIGIGPHGPALLGMNDTAHLL